MGLVLFLKLHSTLFSSYEPDGYGVVVILEPEEFGGGQSQEIMIQLSGINLLPNTTTFCSLYPMTL